MWCQVLGLVLATGIGVPGTAAQQREARRQERREDAFRMVDAYVIAHIQESLDLDDDVYAKVIPLVGRLQKTRREYYQGRAGAQRQMRHLLRSGTATEAQVRDALDEFKALETSGPESIRKRMEELDAVLTPVQQAKYRVFEVEVERRMRALMRRGGGSGSPGPE